MSERIKCSDCRWLNYEKIMKGVGVKCENPKKKKRKGDTASYRYKRPSITACKKFEPKIEDD